MFRLKEDLREQIDVNFMRKAEPIIDELYAQGGKCYCLRVTDCGGVMLPYSMVVSKGFNDIADKLFDLIFDYDKTDADLQTNMCVTCDCEQIPDVYVEMYEEV